MEKRDEMKKTLFALLAAVGLALSAHAQDPYPLRVDSLKPSIKKLTVYRANGRTVRVSFFDGTNATAISSEVPFMAWATNSTSASVVTSTYSVVAGKTGVVDFTWSPADLNYAPGRYQYEVGLKAGTTPTVFRHGQLVLRGSPYSAGATPAQWTTNVYLGLLNFIGQFTGDGGGLTNITTTETDPVWTAASNTAVFLDAQYPNAVLATGARAMSGNLDMGGNTITNMPTLSYQGHAASMLDLAGVDVGIRDTANELFISTHSGGQEIRWGDSGGAVAFDLGGTGQGIYIIVSCIYQLGVTLVEVCFSII